MAQGLLQTGKANAIPGRHGTDGKAASEKCQVRQDVDRVGHGCLAGWDAGEQTMS